ncbi:unnamed protein product [Calypogeia fissa]
MDPDKRRKDKRRVRRPSAFANFRNLDYTHVPEVSPQPGRRASLPNIRPLDYIHAPESSFLQRRTSSFSVRPLDYIHVPHPPPREASSSTTRTLNYVLGPEPSPSQPPQARRKSSFQSRDIDYLHAPEPPPTRRDSSHDSTRLVDYTHVCEPPSRESSSSAGRTLNYTKHSDCDYVQRDRNLAKSLSLDYMRRGSSSEQPPESAGRRSSCTIRILDYTNIPDRSQTDGFRRSVSVPMARAIDYTASSPPVRRMSSASRVRALDFIHNGNSEYVEHVRSGSSLSNIRMVLDEEDINDLNQDDSTVSSD